MYRIVDSSELIIYQARKILGTRNSAEIALVDVIKTATAIEEADASIRVNLGRSSLSHFVSVCHHNATIDNGKIAIRGIDTPAIQQVFKQYGPSGHTMSVINSISSKKNHGGSKR